jgi:hypothetical protein
MNDSSCIGREWEGNSKTRRDELELGIVEVIDSLAGWSSIEDLQRELNI